MTMPVMDFLTDEDHKAGHLRMQPCNLYCIVLYCIYQFL